MITRLVLLTTLALLRAQVASAQQPSESSRTRDFESKLLAIRIEQAIKYGVQPGNDRDFLVGGLAVRFDSVHQARGNTRFVGRVVNPLAVGMYVLSLTFVADTLAACPYGDSLTSSCQKAATTVIRHEVELGHVLAPGNSVPFTLSVRTPGTTSLYSWHAFPHFRLIFR